MENPEESELDIDLSYAQKYRLSIVYKREDLVINSRSYVREKILAGQGKLHCDHCGKPFPFNISFFVKLDDRNQRISCYPCFYSQTGNPYIRLREIRRLQDEELKRSKGQQSLF
jgi:hypothetical protein